MSEYSFACFAYFVENDAFLISCLRRSFSFIFSRYSSNINVSWTVNDTCDFLTCVSPLFLRGFPQQPRPLNMYLWIQVHFKREQNKMWHLLFLCLSVGVFVCLSLCLSLSLSLSLFLSLSLSLSVSLSLLSVRFLSNCNVTLTDDKKRMRFWWDRQRVTLCTRVNLFIQHYFSQVTFPFYSWLFHLENRHALFSATFTFVYDYLKKKKKKNLRVIGLCHLALITPPFYSLSLSPSLCGCACLREIKRERQRERDRERERQRQRERQREIVCFLSPPTDPAVMSRWLGIACSFSTARSLK